MTFFVFILNIENFKVYHLILSHAVSTESGNSRPQIVRKVFSTISHRCLKGYVNVMQNQMKLVRIVNISGRH